VTAIYAEGETLILAAITGNVLAALKAADPPAQMLVRAGTTQTAVRRILDRVEARARRVVPTVLSEAYGRGHGLERRAADQAVQDVLGRLASLRGGILRWVTGLWNRLTAAVGGQRDPRQAADQVLQGEAGRGITGFTDSHGRRWSLTAYVDQTVQHAAGNTAMDGWLQRAQETGDLVVVRPTPTACPICRPWVARILSISGTDPDRPSVREARSAGLWHPNCQHPVAVWHPGFHWLHSRGRGGTQAMYEATQRERRIERTLAHWERRLAVALDDVSKASARRKVRQWRTALADHRRAYRLNALA
jgi:hypothetical protein